MPEASETDVDQQEAEENQKRGARAFDDHDNLIERWKKGVRKRLPRGDVDPRRFMRECRNVGRWCNILKAKLPHGSLKQAREIAFPKFSKRRCQEFQKLDKHWYRLGDKRPEQKNVTQALKAVQQLIKQDEAEKAKLRAPNAAQRREETKNLFCWAKNGFEGPSPLISQVANPVRKLLLTDKLALDSGAHTYANKVDENGNPDWFFSPEFQKYVDRYGKYLQENYRKYDWVASCDARQSPDAGYAAHLLLKQRYGLYPVPCVHLTTKPNDPLISLDEAKRLLGRYLELGDRHIALGGLKYRTDHGIEFVTQLIDWAVEQAPGSLFHLYAVTTPEMLFCHDAISSADATTWQRAAAGGSVYVPKDDWAIRPHQIKVGEKVTTDEDDEDEDCEVIEKAVPLDEVSDEVLAALLDWLHDIRVPFAYLGKHDDVGTSYRARVAANIHYFRRLQDEVNARRREAEKDFIFYYSGSCTPNPELVVQMASIMPTYKDLQDKEHQEYARLRRIIHSRALATLNGLMTAPKPRRATRRPVRPLSGHVSSPATGSSRRALRA